MGEKAALVKLLRLEIKKGESAIAEVKVKKPQGRSTVKKGLREPLLPLLCLDRRLAALEPASDSSFSLLWAPLLLIFLALAYLVMRRFTAPRRPRDYGKFVKHGSRQVPAWRQVHESCDPYDIV